MAQTNKFGRHLTVVLENHKLDDDLWTVLENSLGADLLRRYHEELPDGQVFALWDNLVESFERSFEWQVERDLFEKGTSK